MRNKEDQLLREPGRPGTPSLCRAQRRAGIPVSIIFLWLLVFLVGGRASELKINEHVIFFPAMARPVQGQWELLVHGWVFEPEQHKILSAVFRRAIGIHEADLTAAEKAIFQERSQYFLEDNERRKTITILVGGNFLEVGPSAPNGHFITRFPMSLEMLQDLKQRQQQTNGAVPFEMLILGRRMPAPYGVIHLFEDRGLSVVSDIDDTIKISNVNKKKLLLQNTFCRVYQPVPGMAPLYRSWQASKGAQFHYISAMPWQLYVPMSQFMASHGFPSGTFSCRYFRLKDMSFLDLLRSPEKYKRETIEQLVQQFPNRRFVLVGDSGEQDPEVYGAIARSFTNQVSRIFIRDVTGEAPEARRYRKAFQDLPRAQWRIFKDAKELEGAL